MHPERTRLPDELRAGTRAYLDALAAVPDLGWDWRPGPDRWSVAEATEHVTAVLRDVHHLAIAGFGAAPPLPEDRRITDEFLVRLLADRSRPRPAPEPVRPTGRWSTRAEMLEVFAASRDGLIQWASTAGDLRRLIAPHPLLGPLDGAQWILFAAAHTARHARQVTEITASPGYPGQLLAP